MPPNYIYIFSEYITLFKPRNKNTYLYATILLSSESIFSNSDSILQQ